MSSFISFIRLSFSFREACASAAVAMIAFEWIEAVEKDEGHRQPVLSKCEETADEAQNRICMIALQNLKQGNVRLGK